ncbi:MAG: AbrB/MazE/SpoVT family DNA-binding domain-containing protein [Candidatus Bathyarchaeales archaeon]
MPNMPRTKDFVKLRRQGNSLVITIPKEIAATLGWKFEDELYIEAKDGVLFVKKAQ